jgi:hypothetical protein
MGFRIDSYWVGLSMYASMCGYICHTCTHTHTHTHPPAHRFKQTFVWTHVQFTFRIVHIWPSLLYQSKCIYAPVCEATCQGAHIQMGNLHVKPPTHPQYYTQNYMCVVGKCLRRCFYRWLQGDLWGYSAGYIHTSNKFLHVFHVFSINTATFFISIQTYFLHGHEIYLLVHLNF